MIPRRATKIVATLGPACSDPALLEQMLRAGVNVVRLNFSHGVAQDHIERARLVREVSLRVGREVAIIADLQGPKIRVGKFALGKVMLEVGQKFVLDAARTELGDIDAVGLDYKSLPREVKAGDVLLLNDGLIVITVDAVRGDAIHTTVNLGGELSNNKGINRRGGADCQGHGRHPHSNEFSGRLRGGQFSEKRHRYGNGASVVQCGGWGVWP